jgi:hypothetical protein
LRRRSRVHLRSSLSPNFRQEEARDARLENEHALHARRKHTAAASAEESDEYDEFAQSGAK